jgi:mannitol/fructose-specific phosphotransferase system IIA component (Ntr-type)
MELREFFSEEAIKLDLSGTSKDDVLKELIGLLQLDEKPVNFFFLIVAPPLEVSNQYLPVLGKIAQFSKEPDVPERLFGLTEPQQFLALLEEKGV